METLLPLILGRDNPDKDMALPPHNLLNNHTQIKYYSWSDSNFKEILGEIYKPMPIFQTEAHI